jgi:hypothetical protein
MPTRRSGRVNAGAAATLRGVLLLAGVAVAPIRILARPLSGPRVSVVAVAVAPVIVRFQQRMPGIATVVSTCLGMPSR